MEWISVDERLPYDDLGEEDKFVAGEWFVIRAKLKIGTIDSYFCAFFDGDRWRVSMNWPVTTKEYADKWLCWMYPLDETLWEVTHWMPLKEVPRPEKGKT